MSGEENGERAEEQRHDLVVIGAGPGGYVAAIRAAQLGLDVGVVDENEALGGTCLRVGCIPSKALLESTERLVAARDDLAEHGIVAGAIDFDLATMLKRKDRITKTLTGGIRSLFKKNKIRHYVGRGRLTADRSVVVEGPEPARLSAENVLLATGSTPSTIPGVELDGDRIGSSTEALAYPQLPEHLVVIGAGVIGLELGSVWRRLGSRVTVLEYLDRILPGTDTEVAKEAQKLLSKQGLEFQLSSRVTGAAAEGRRCRVEIDGAEAIECDRVLVAVGRRPCSFDLGLDEVGVEVDQRGFVKTQAFQTNVDGIYAIGDLIGGAQLAHKAEEEGIACVEAIAGARPHVNYDAIPSVVYTHPEIAAVGATQEELEEAAIPFRVGRFPFRANGRARALGETNGFVKVLAHADTDRLLGIHILGARAGDLIAEAATAIEFHASAEDLFRTSHAHPTLAEVLKEAALDSAGRAIHI